MSNNDNTVRPGSIAAFVASPLEVLSDAIDLQDAAAAESVLANCLRYCLDNPEQNKKGALICDDNGSLAWVRIDVYPQPPDAAAAEIDLLKAEIERLRDLGNVFVPPAHWDYFGMGGGPSIDDFEQIDLTSY